MCAASKHALAQLLACHNELCDLCELIPKCIALTHDVISDAAGAFGKWSRVHYKTLSEIEDCQMVCQCPESCLAE